MDLTDLIFKINKLVFLNRLFIIAGVESMNVAEAVYVLEDEIEQLEKIYQEVEEQFAMCV